MHLSLSMYSCVPLKGLTCSGWLIQIISMIFEVPKSDSQRIGFSDSYARSSALWLGWCLTWAAASAIRYLSMGRCPSNIWHTSRRGRWTSEPSNWFAEAWNVAFPLIFPIIFPMDIPSGFNLPLGSWDIHGSLGNLAGTPVRPVCQRQGWILCWKEKGRRNWRPHSRSNWKRSNARRTSWSKNPGYESSGPKKTKRPAWKSERNSRCVPRQPIWSIFWNVLPELNFGSRRDGDPTRKLNIVNSM